MQITENKPEDFINSLPENERDIMLKLDREISKIFPDRVMWEGKFWGGSDQSIIGYGDLVYINSTKKEVHWFIVGLASQKNYFTVFVNGVIDNKYIAETYKERIGKAKVGKSSISFKNIVDIRMDILREILIKAKEVSSK